MPPTEPPVLVVHFGAVAISLNQTRYAVRARVNLCTYSNQLLTSLRLLPVSPPTSPDASATAIELIPYGRWQEALSGLSKDDIVQVECAHICPSDDLDINAVRLELCDPVPVARAPLVYFYILGANMVPLLVVQYNALSGGLKPASNSVLARFTRHIPWAPGQVPAEEEPRQPEARKSIRDGARNDYSSIAELVDPQSFAFKKKVNLYGVIMECRAPCPTKGIHMRSEVVVADESSCREMGMDGRLKVLPMYCFEAEPHDAIPFRAVGDIIRAHRVELCRYDNGIGNTIIQTSVRFFSTIILWQHDSNDFVPLSSRPPVSTRTFPNPPRDITQNITNYDRERITSLRNWTREYLFKEHTITRPFLRTVLEINLALDTDVFLHKSFDFLCYVEREVSDEGNSDNLELLVSDGLFPDGEKAQKIIVKSDPSFRERPSLRRFTFLDFCPSWALRPRPFPCWVLIRDVHIEIHDSRRIIMLDVGRRTSTLVWNSANAPDVRAVKGNFERLSALQVLQAPEMSKSVFVGNGTNEVLQKKRSQLAGCLNLSENENLVEGGTKQYSPSSCAARRHEPPGKRSASDAIIDAESTRRLFSKKSRPVEGQDAGGSVNEMNGLTSVENKAIEKRFQRCDDSASLILPRKETFRETVVTSHRNGNQLISSIAKMVRSSQNGKWGVHRLRVIARSCSSPRDLRFACKPWCSKCKIYLRGEPKKKSFECVLCRRAFGSILDPDMQWAFSIQLVLEDQAGGRVMGWVEGKEGESLFSGLAPTNLMQDNEARRQVSRYLQVMLAAGNRLDCSVRAYEYEDKHGVYHTACKIFGTHLLPPYIPNVNNDRP